MVIHQETKEGLEIQELEAVVHRLEGRTISADFVQNTAVEYDQFIYPFVESACPVILGIEGRNFHSSSIISHDCFRFGTYTQFRQMGT